MPDPTASPANIGIYSLEDRQKILEAAVSRVNEVTPEARISIVHSGHLEKYIEEHKADPNRYRLIVHDDVHYTAVDVNPRNKTCLVLDAALDDRGFKVNSTFKAHQYKSYFANGLISNQEEAAACRLQNDAYSCTMFALDHCIQLSQAPDSIYADISTKMANFPAGSDLELLAQIDYFPWDALPPNFLWNAQSFSNVLIPYQERMNKDYPGVLQQKIPIISYDQYVQHATYTTIINEVEVMRNQSINAHVFAWAERIYLSTDKAYKHSISNAMQLAINKMKGQGFTTSLKKDKIDKLEAIKKEFDKLPDAHPSFCTAYIQQFENVAKDKRNTSIPQFMRGEATSFAEFKKQLRTLRETPTLPINTTPDPKRTPH